MTKKSPAIDRRRFMAFLGGFGMAGLAFFGEAGDYEKAAHCLQRAISLVPDDPLAYRNLAAAQVALGDRDGARRTLIEALRLDPQNREIQEFLARLEE